MKFKIRALNIKTREEGLKEFKKIGATTAGSHIMVDKLFPISLKVRGINPLGASILKQEMLARGGDVVTSRDALIKTCGKTDVIIQGTLKSIKSLASKIKLQPFGLKALSDNLKDCMDKLSENKKRKILKIDGKKFDLNKEVLIMGVLNITPDSFYDGGYYFE